METSDNPHWDIQQLALSVVAVIVTHTNILVNSNDFYVQVQRSSCWMSAGYCSYCPSLYTQKALATNQKLMKNISYQTVHCQFQIQMCDNKPLLFGKTNLLHLLNLDLFQCFNTLLMSMSYSVRLLCMVVYTTAVLSMITE